MLPPLLGSLRFSKTGRESKGLQSLTVSPVCSEPRELYAEERKMPLKSSSLRFCMPRDLEGEVCTIVRAFLSCSFLKMRREPPSESWVWCSVSALACGLLPPRRIAKCMPVSKKSRVANFLPLPNKKVSVASSERERSSWVHGKLRGCRFSFCESPNSYINVSFFF